MNKKGQWAHAMARERRSQERRDRLDVTKEFLKEGLTADEIAVRLGISGNTVRQYIKEVKHIADEEKYFEDLQKKVDKLTNERDRLNAQGNLDVQKLKKIIENGVQTLELLVKQIESYERRGINTSSIKRTMVPAIRGLYSSMYCSTMSSFDITFNDPSNKKSIPENEVSVFNSFYGRWKRKVEKGDVAKEDYEKFVEEVKVYDTPDKIKNISKILKQIEEKIGLNENLKKLDKSVNEIIQQIGIPRSEIDGSKLFYVTPALGLIINLFVPGLGTLFSFGEQKKKNGIIQLVLFSLGILISYIGWILIITAWILALVDGINTLKNE